MHEVVAIFSGPPKWESLLSGHLIEVDIYSPNTTEQHLAGGMPTSVGGPPYLIACVHLVLILFQFGCNFVICSVTGSVYSVSFHLSSLSLWSLSLSQIPLPLSLSVYLSESPWAMSLRRVLVYLQTIIMLNRSDVPFWILEINVDIYC